MPSTFATRSLTATLLSSLFALQLTAPAAAQRAEPFERRDLPPAAGPSEPADDRYAQIYGGSSAPRPGSLPPEREPYPPDRRDDAYRPNDREPASRGYDERPRPARNDAYVPPRDPGYRRPEPYPSSSTVPEDGDLRSRPRPYDEPDRRYDRYDRYDRYEPAPAPQARFEDDEPRDGTFSMREITAAGHGFFGSISQGLASVFEYAFRSKGRPNGYILGEDLGGAFVAGLRYGEGRLYTKDAGTHKVFWQGPSLGYDAGAEGSKVMVLVYNLRDPSDIYRRFGGVAGSAYVIGGVGLNFQSNEDVVLAPIRAGVGLRLGANIGYLKYTRRPTWNPF
jgi:hypothetical protein